MLEASSSSDPVDVVGVVNQEPIVTVVIDIINEKAVNADEVKARHLFDIRADKNLNWLLDDWQTQFKVARDRIETKSTRTNNAKNDLYQWIGFFSVFQGVVLTAVAQSSTLGCQQSWAPAALSLIASLVTVVSVHFKLVNYRGLNASLLKEIHQSQILHDQIAALRAQGKDFNFGWFIERTQEISKRKDEKKPQGLQDKYYWAVILALVTFSTIILLCCIIVLCGPHRYHPGS
ncbi:unnamed protein product [Sphagnum troendelagicum]|uniref:SMODS and SLOG-associating 2TM effector domain-containing protein n=1 Tax=Sphagnum troendelagicum TaxID=128251 RepID=A0ABP0UCQ0_9BRYO